MFHESECVAYRDQVFVVAKGPRAPARPEQEQYYNVKFAYRL